MQFLEMPIRKVVHRSRCDEGGIHAGDFTLFRKSMTAKRDFNAWLGEPCPVRCTLSLTSRQVRGRGLDFFVCLAIWHFCNRGLEVELSKIVVRLTS